MPEMSQSGSEGGVRLSLIPTPISGAAKLRPTHPPASPFRPRLTPAAGVLLYFVVCRNMMYEAA